MSDEQTYETLLYATEGPVATITLNRPEELNTIVPPGGRCDPTRAT